MTPSRLLPLAALVLAATSASGQPTPARTCLETLPVAAEQYREQAYVAVEPLALSCIYDPAATPAQIEQAYRLLTLSFLHQGLLADARVTVARFLSVAPDYEADPLHDLPVYVSLVRSVRDQLRPEAPVTTATSTTGTSTTGTSAAGTTVAGAGVTVDVNTATAEELDRVPGIGPALAARIIAYRDSYGAFRRVGDLEAVSGIGPRSLERMAPYLVAGPDRAPQRPAAPVRPLASAPAPAAQAAPSTVRVNLNTATVEELTALSGIGPSLAARIVEFRERNGPFRTVEDVALVRGIGPGKLEGFAGQATVD